MSPESRDFVLSVYFEVWRGANVHNQFKMTATNQVFSIPGDPRLQFTHLAELDIVYDSCCVVEQMYVTKEAEFVRATATCCGGV